MNTINAEDYPGPCSAFQAAIDAGLPRLIQCGPSGFYVTDENHEAFHLGVLFATSEHWEKAKANIERNTMNENQNTSELEALRKDGERMSWLEQHNFRPEDSIALLSEVSVRAAIDSAMEKETK